MLEVRDRAGVLHLCMANKPANILSVGNGMAAALAEAIEDARTRGGFRGIIISGRGEMFCGGADLCDLDRADVLRAVFDRIEQSQIPVIMAMHGRVLGGGVELALAGHWRIAAPGTKLALPEVGLGLLPGLGGTQRLPRLIGAGPALDMMLAGNIVTAEDALGLGLIDRIAQGDIIDSAIELIGTGKLMPRPTRAMLPPSDAREVAIARRKMLIPGLNRAPERILDCIAAISDDFEAGMRFEAQRIDELVASEASRGLRHAFFAQRTAARVPGLVPGQRAHVPATAHVIGTGALARRTAQRLAEAGLSVRFDETAALSVADNGESDLIVRCDRAGCLATADNSLLATYRVNPRLQAEVQGAEGLEFHCPGDNRLMEVVRGPDSAPVAMASMVALGKALGKTTIVSGDVGGSIFERLAAAYVAPVASLVAGGLTAERIDEALERWGMAEGPCKFGDRFGLLSSGTPAAIPSAPLPDDEGVIDRFLQALIDEGARLIADGVAWRAEDIDVVAESGLGFPRERGGPLFQAELMGLPIKDCRMSFVPKGTNRHDTR